VVCEEDGRKRGREIDEYFAFQRKIHNFSARDGRMVVSRIVVLN